MRDVRLGVDVEVLLPYNTLESFYRTPCSPKLRQLPSETCERNLRHAKLPHAAMIGCPC